MLFVGETQGPILQTGVDKSIEVIYKEDGLA